MPFPIVQTVSCNPVHPGVDKYQAAGKSSSQGIGVRLSPLGEFILATLFHRLLISLRVKPINYFSTRLIPHTSTINFSESGWTTNETLAYSISFASCSQTSPTKGHHLPTRTIHLNQHSAHFPVPRLEEFGHDCKMRTIGPRKCRFQNPNTKRALSPQTRYDLV